MSSEQITEQPASPVETTPTTTETKPVETTIASTTEPQPTVNKTWKEAISEEFRNDPNINKFTEIDALAKSYINATKMIGQDKVAVPNKNSTEDQWNEVYDKLGRPESADKYSLNVKSDTVPIDEGSIKQFAEKFLKVLIPKKKIKIEYDLLKPNGTPRKVLDISLAKQYGWKPNININKEILETYKSYLSQIKKL